MVISPGLALIALRTIRPSGDNILCFLSCKVAIKSLNVCYVFVSLFVCFALLFIEGIFELSQKDPRRKLSKKIVIVGSMDL